MSQTSETDEVAAASTLFASLSLLEERFAQDELAYLALTSKAELPIRDRLAWHMQASLGDSFVIAREWRRADLAVLRKDAPVLQVEAKAMYAFDLLSHSNRPKYVAKLTADGVKMAVLAPNSAAFLLALVTHIHGEVPAHLRKHVVKYSPGIVAALSKHDGDGTRVRDTARGLWEAELVNLDAPWQRFTLDGGRQWGLHVEIDAFLVGPLLAP